MASKAGQFSTLSTYTRTWTRRSMPLPAAASAAATLSSTWRACASKGASASLVPSGPIGSCPDTYTMPLATQAWL
ncbi:Uncharacterised protein [Bordetella pertussis]|nr:Uncharacterised protein [Bordetella pertussis]